MPLRDACKRSQQPAASSQQPAASSASVRNFEQAAGLHHLLVAPSGVERLFHSPNFGSQLSATVYLTSAPVFLLRITTTAIAPGGAFSAAIVSVRWGRGSSSWRS
jgi:hypothetical protein